MTTNIDHNTITNTHNLTTNIDHDAITAGTIAAHDTTATGTQLTALTDNSIADALHRHSELVAPDGSPDPVISIDNAGVVSFNDFNIVSIGYIGLSELSSDPAAVAEGKAKIWLGDGTDSYDDGDIMVTVQAGAVTKTYRFYDHSLANTTNIAAGYQALNVLTSGTDNVGVGYQALYSNTTGISNVAIGSGALRTNMIGIYNTAIGTDALLTYTGNSNVAVGYTALQATTGIGNMGIGYRALYTNSVGMYNTALGNNALYRNNATHYNVAVGYQALFNNIGTANVGIGSFALINNTTGNYNVAIGDSALYNSTVTHYNTAIGYQALYDNTSTSNVGIGYQALRNNDGVANVGIGYQTLLVNTTGHSNTGIGYATLSVNTEGIYNTAIGFGALYTNLSGDNNTAIGRSAGVGITTGNNNTIIGANVIGLAAALTGYVIIADGAGTKRIVVDGSGNIMLGDGGVTNYTNIGVTGDVTFKGTGGLVIGCMYIPGTDIVVTITDANPTEVYNATSDGWSAGELNEVTFPTGGTEHYLTITKPGKYEVIWNMSYYTAAGAVRGGVMVDDVAVRYNGEAQGIAARNICAACIIDCPNGTEEISLWVSNSTSTDVTVYCSTVTIKLLAGT